MDKIHLIEQRNKAATFNKKWNRSLSHDNEQKNRQPLKESIKKQMAELHKSVNVRKMEIEKQFIKLCSCITYYNHYRIKVKLDGMSPIQYRIHVIQSVGCFTSNFLESEVRTEALSPEK